MTPRANNHPPRDAAFVLLVVALGMALRVAVLLTYERDVDGDEAVVGTMALRIWRDGETFSSWPGRRYNGGAAINACLGALAFRCWGVSSLTFKMPALLWTIGTLVVGYLLARRFLGPSPARWALLLMALGPPTFCRWGVKPYLGTNATLINLAIAYALLSTLFPAAGSRRARIVWPVAAGALCGFGLYNSPFVLPMLVACAVFGLWLWKGLPRHPGFWLGAATFGVTAAPTLVAMWQGEAAELTPRSGLTALALAVARASVKVPHFFGQPYRYFGAAALPAYAAVAAVAHLLALAALIVLFGPRVWRGVTQARRSATPDVPALAMAFVLFYLAAHAGAFVLSPQDVQYLVPAYPFLAMALASALALGRGSGPRAWRIATWGLSIVLLGANTWGSVALAIAKERKGFDKYVYGGVQFQPLIALLDAERISHVYASSAIAHVLGFESRRRIVSISYDNVFPDDNRSAQRSKACAYVFATDSDYDRILRSHLHRRNIDFRERSVGQWTIRYGLGAEVRPWEVRWETDHLGPFPNRADLCQAALRLEPWRADYWCRLLETRQQSPAPSGLEVRQR